MVHLGRALACVSCGSRVTRLQHRSRGFSLDNGCSATVQCSQCAMQQLAAHRAVLELLRSQPSPRTIQAAASAACSAALPCPAARAPAAAALRYRCEQLPRSAAVAAAAVARLLQQPCASSAAGGSLAGRRRRVRRAAEAVADQAARLGVGWGGSDSTHVTVFRPQICKSAFPEGLPGTRFAAELHQARQR